MLIQRRNLIESVRPELVLIGWTRRQEGAGDSAHEVISFQFIKNVGRGAALHIHFGTFQQIDNRPTAISATQRMPILAVNESVEVNARIVVWWKNVKTSGPAESKFLPLTISISCWDSRGMRYETRYDLFVVPLLPNVGVGEEIAPGVALANRIVTSKSVWWPKLRSRLNSLRQLPRKVWTRMRGTRK